MPHAADRIRNVALVGHRGSGKTSLMEALEQAAQDAAVEAIVCALSIRDGFIHQTLGYTTPDPECDLDYCVNGPVEMPVTAALSNSLGFGGHNATLCFKKCTGEGAVE